MPKDPVCGMDVNETQEKAEHKGQIYYFCTDHCRGEFVKNPEKYFKKKNFLMRFLEWLGKASEKEFGNKPPSCH